MIDFFSFFRNYLELFALGDRFSGLGPYLFLPFIPGQSSTTTTSKRRNAIKPKTIIQATSSLGFRRRARFPRNSRENSLSANRLQRASRRRSTRSPVFLRPKTRSRNSRIILQSSTLFRIEDKSSFIRLFRLEFLKTSAARAACYCKQERREYLPTRQKIFKRN